MNIFSQKKAQVNSSTRTIYHQNDALPSIKKIQLASILVIEDEPAILRVVTKFLQFEGYQVVEATSADEGLSLFRQEPTDLVITDIFMPGKDGIEFIRELLADYEDVKILALAGDPRMLAITKEAGAHNALPKPFSREELIEAVSELLKGD